MEQQQQQQRDNEAGAELRHNTIDGVNNCFSCNDFNPPVEGSCDPPSGFKYVSLQKNNCEV